MPTFYCFSLNIIRTGNIPNIKVPSDMLHFTVSTKVSSQWDKNKCNDRQRNLRKSNFQICQFAIPPTEGAAIFLYRACTTPLHLTLKHIKVLLQLYVLSGFPLAQNNHFRLCCNTRTHLIIYGDPRKELFQIFIHVHNSNNMAKSGLIILLISSCQMVKWSAQIFHQILRNSENFHLINRHL